VAGLALLGEGLGFGPVVGGELEGEGQDEVLKGVGGREDPFLDVLLRREFEGDLDGGFIRGGTQGI
jgi:hypothetical protein